MNALRTFVEKEVHDGEVWLKAVLLGEYLEVRLFQTEVIQNCVRVLGMDLLAEVFADDGASVRLRDDSLAEIVACRADLHRETDLLDEEPQQGHVQVYEPFRATVKNGKKLILIVFEAGGGVVGGNESLLVLLRPGLGPVHLYFRNGKFVSASFVHDGKG